MHFLGKRQLLVTSSFKATHPWLIQFELFDVDNWKKVNSVKRNGANTTIYFLLLRSVFLFLMNLPNLTQYCLAVRDPIIFTVSKLALSSDGNCSTCFLFLFSVSRAAVAEVNTVNETDGTNKLSERNQQVKQLRVY